MAGEYVTLPVADGTDMRAYVTHDERAEPAPGLIIFQEAFGVNSYIRDVADRFAREGYVVIAPELFHRTAPGFESDYVERKGVGEQMAALTDEGIRADATAAHAWLQSQPFVDSAHIGTVGFCMGGRAAFLANATLPLSAAVSFYGGGIAQKHLDDAQNQHGSILLLWGGKDAHITAEDRHAVADALTSANKDFAEATFSYGDHGFFCDARASYNERASQEAWALVLAFLKTSFSRT